MASFPKPRQKHLDTASVSSTTSSTFLDSGIDNIPANLTCPLTYELFRDPVILVSTGQTYERSEIEKWFKINRTDPLSGLRVKDTTLVPNLAIKGLCDEFLEKWYKKQVNSQQEQNRTNDSLSNEIAELYQQLALKTKSCRSQAEHVGQAQKELIKAKEVSLKVINENQACLEDVLQAFSQLELCLKGKAIVQGAAKQVLKRAGNFEDRFVEVAENLEELVVKELSFDAELEKQFSIQKEVKELQSKLEQKHREHGTPITFSNDFCIASQYKKRLSISTQSTQQQNKLVDMGNSIKGGTDTDHVKYKQVQLDSQSPCFRPCNNFQYNENGGANFNNQRQFELDGRKDSNAYSQNIYEYDSRSSDKFQYGSNWLEFDNFNSDQGTEYFGATDLPHNSYFYGQFSDAQEF